VAPAAAKRYSEEQIRRGEYLVEFGNCGECHTPWVFDPAIGGPVTDLSRRLSGHPAGAPGPSVAPGREDMGVTGPTGTSFALPFGTVYTPNLTPDVDTGIGSWTEEMWLKIFETGTHLGGGTRPILPPMPWLGISMLDRDDLVSIYAYLMSIPPVRNGAPTFNPPMEIQDAIRQGNDKLISARRKAKVPGKSS
jgi:hypothetical protein